ncbi:DUF2586 family protein [Hymenobacter glacieicola]|uniref:DUF2586 family protein n=1 Tax=Hymenobacter glacieicola TaxID=1562124 RepID=A0ABQ1WLW7_9BACT|nr:DUF2586 family protein [Hymenobacter glacieicola]GGG33379.1 hypothetical protein GCM10011378_07320 [Hymenobacter glacieicola]
MLSERPNVNVLLGNGNLAREVDNPDGLALLVIGAPAGYQLTEALLYSLRGAELAGATAEADLAANALVYEHIKDYFVEAGDGAALRVLLVPNATTMAQLFSPGNAAYTSLQTKLKEEKGVVRLLGVALNPAAAEVAGGAGITADLLAAIPLAQTFANAEFDAFRPLDIVLEGRLFTGTATNATDLRTLNAPSVAVTIGRDQLRVNDLVAAGLTLANKFAQVGKVLGRLSAMPVQRSIGRVKSGALEGITQASLSGSTLVTSLSDGKGGDLSILDGKGYIFPLIHAGKDGFFYNNDATCVAKTNDYAYLKLSRTIKKAARIARTIYLEELLDDVLIDRATGYLPAIEVSRFQQTLKTAIEEQMGENISAVTVYVDPKQNVLSASKIKALVRVVPRGTAEQIEATVEYNNPFNTAA